MTLLLSYIPPNRDLRIARHAARMALEYVTRDDSGTWVVDPNDVRCIFIDRQNFPHTIHAPQYWALPNLPDDIESIVIRATEDGEAGIYADGEPWHVGGSTLVDRDGYDADGYDEDGYDRDGYDSEGFGRDGYNRDGYDCDGYDCDGYDCDGYDITGYNEDGFNREGYDREGYDEDGLDRRGSDRCNNDDCDCECHACHAGDSCDCEEDGLPDYHATCHSAWRRRVASEAGNRDVYGVELETECVNRDVAYENRPDWAIGEKDGSLDTDKGVEWIGEPMPRSAYTIDGMWCNWLRELRNDYDAIGWNAGENYGMHVNVNRGSMDEITAIRFAFFIHSQKDLSERVAGRKETRWAQYSYKAPDHTALENPDKYRAVRVGRTVLEVRIFRATLRPESFLKNLEYVFAVLDYARAVNDTSDMSRKGFLDYIRDAATSRYDNLKQWINDKGIV